MGSEFESEADPVQKCGQGEDEDGDPGGSGDSECEAVFGVGVVVVAEGGEVEPRADAVAEEVGEEDVLAGEGERLGDCREAPDVGEEVEDQPEGGGDGAGPEAPRGGRVVLEDAVGAVEEEGGDGEAEDEEG